MLLTNNTAGDSTVSSGGFGGGLYSSGAVLIMDTTVSNNTAGGYTCNGLGGAAGYGGGVLFGSGRIVRSSFTGNAGGALTVVSGSCDASKGGAVHSFGSTVIEDSHFQNNSAADGGVYYGGPLTMRRSSAVANAVTNAGAALYLSGSSHIVENSTFSDNQSNANRGAIEFISGTELRINQSTNVCQNHAGVTLTTDQHNAAPADCSGVAPTTLGNNLFGATGGCSADALLQDATVAALATAVDPLLSTASNGTRYHAPVVDGPIVDRGARACACDIGAVELQRPSVLVSDESPGLSCPAGGKRIDTLDCAGAIIDTSFVCTPIVTVGPTGATGPAGVAGATGPTSANGADGMNGVNGAPGVTGPPGNTGTSGSLLQTETIAVGDTDCAEGGLLLLIGDDDDGDGTLAAAETRETHKLCTPARAPRGGCASTNPSALGALVLVLVVLRRRRSNGAD